MRNDRDKILEYKKRRDARLNKRGLSEMEETRLDGVGAFYERRNKRRAERNLPEIKKPVDKRSKTWYNGDSGEDVVNGEKVQWKTADNGKHYAINGEGEITAGPKALKGIDLSPNGGKSESVADREKRAKAEAQAASASQSGASGSAEKPRAKKYEPSENYKRYKKAAEEKVSKVFPVDPEHSTGINYKGHEVGLKIQSAEAQKLFNRLQDKKEHVSLDELREHPVVKEMDEISDKVTEAIGGSTHLINTPEREELRQEIRERFLSLGSARIDPATGKTVAFDGEVRREHKCVIYTGLPAAGKSSVVDPLSQETGAFVFDNDTIKGMIPEFEATGGAAANAVHEESSDIQKSCLREFMKGGSRNGDNIAYPCIGDNEEKLMKNIRMFEEAGYEVEVRCLDATPELSVGRCVGRGIETGRIIKTDVIFKYGDKPTKVYHALEEKYGDKYAKGISEAK